MKYITLFIFSLITAYLSLLIGQKIRIIDNPSSEKIHNVPITKTGGLGIFLNYILRIIYLYEISCNLL